MPTKLTKADRERIVDQAAVMPQIPQTDKDLVDLAWMEQAGDCREYLDWFTADANETMQIAAARICRTTCPVIAQCRLQRRDMGGTGTWGGVFYGAAGPKVCLYQGCSERARGRFCSFDHGHRVLVGTVAGYNLHIHSKVEACTRCLIAQHRHLVAIGKLPAYPAERGPVAV